MPGTDAKFADVYLVAKAATVNPAHLGKPTRPLVCMKEQRGDTAWLGLPRSTSGTRDIDARDSAPVPHLGLDKYGWWTARYVHPVLKEKTGVRGVCDYKGILPNDQVKVAREVFRNRRFDS